MKMKNKIELKKSIIISIFVILIWSSIFALFNLYQYSVYTNNFNNKIDQIVTKIATEYPDIQKSDVIEILNGDEKANGNILKEYGIDLKKESIVMENDKYSNMFIILNVGILILLWISLLIVFLKYNNSKDKKLKEITQYIEEINRKNYKLNIDDNTEDELSILKNEVYKTTIMLKEQAENSLNDKVNLKNSLSDISHQLKTPLTSITIMLDNIIDNPNMDQETRSEFIKDVKREITNINFLVQALLKLSKFDTNTIKFTNKEEKVVDILSTAIENVSVLCDLKDIEIVVTGNIENTINCDIRWQVEAISNVLKNSVEYSNNSSKIQIVCNKNKVYSEIRIIDNGKGIDKEDIKHIFERFYKGKNSSRDSVGIGLALAKTIIEQNNGTISVESEIGKGTTFIIKYFE